MATAPKADLVVHEESLARLRSPEAYGLTQAMELGLQWLGGRVSLTEVRFEEPAWRTRAWVTTATLTCNVDGGAHTIPIALPWLLDSTSAITARAAGIRDRVGQFRGTYWEGRFRQPLVRYVRRPGIHRVTSPIEDGNTYRGMVIGELGSGWILRHQREKGIDSIVIRSRLAALDRDEQNTFDVADLLGGGRSDELAELHRTLVDPRRFAGDAPTEQALRDLVEWLATIEAEDRGTRERPGRLLRGEPLDPTDAMAVPLAERHWSTAGLGDIIAASVSEAVARTARLTRPELEAEAVVARLRAAIVGAVDRVARGSEKQFSAGVVNERPINTLSGLEASRQRTFLGYGGLEEYQGRLDLRVLPSTWRELLCPLQTQESANIGLIRHTALRDWTGPDPAGVAPKYGDLSIAAALIPYVGHDDPTRAALGSKMLKQAVILDDPQPPLIRTGVEALVGEVGSTRSFVAGGRPAIDPVSGIARVGTVDLPIGSRSTYPALPGDRWTVTDPEIVEVGGVLAHAPDVQIENGQPVLAYGVNATVAFLAWEGMNYEDGIVISQSFASRMSSTHTVRLSAPYDPDLGAEELLTDAASQPVSAGTPLLRVHGDPDRILSMPERGHLVAVHDDTGYRYSDRGSADAYRDDIHVAYHATRELQVGDKLTTRHGGKGVVTRIEPDERMPRLPDGRIIEVLLNPLGVVRRLNMGTLMELASGLELVLSKGWDSGLSRVVPRRLGRSARLALAGRLAKLGAPGGTLPLHTASGEPIGPLGGVMVGPLYLVKLDHLAKAKGGSRDDAPPSPVTFQPVKASIWRSDRRRSAPQRLGEMELWSLEAMRATKTLDDLMAVRGVGESELREDRGVLPAGLRAALGYLAVAGVGFVSTGEWQGRLTARDITVDPATGAPNELVRALWRGGEGGTGLRDVIETFAERADGELSARMRQSRAAQGRSTPGPGALANAILEYAIADTDGGATRPDRGVGETPRYEIVLPAPVDHPWFARVPFSDDYRVLPPLERLAILPSSAFRGSTDPRRDPLRRRYREILKWVLLHRDSTDRSVQETALKHIASEVRAFLGGIGTPGSNADTRSSGTIAGRVTGKYGLLRRNGLGAAAIRSGRAVLVGDPTLDPEYVRIPRWMAEDLGIGVELGPYSDVVIVNRQPTLHPYGIQALRAEVWDESAVALHPLLLSAIAGDFDGDTVAVHRLASEGARQEIWDLRRPAAALRSGANGALWAKLDQDVQLGLALSRGDVTVKAIDLAEAAIAGMPVDTPSNRAAALRTIAGIQYEGLLAANRWGPAVVALEPPPEDVALRGHLENSAPELAAGFATGAAGTFGSDDLRHWLIGRGTATSPVVDNPEAPIDGNYLDGISDESYFAAAQPAILGIAAKKLLTPYAGTLTRRLVRHAFEIVVSEKNCHPDGGAHSMFDCLTIAGPCADAYGDNPETGLPVAVGDPVGIRAALFVGERGTQAALKSIHDRSGRIIGRSDELSGKAKLKELSAILLRNGADRGDGFGGGGGPFRLPKAVPALGASYEPLRGRKNTPLTYSEFRKRIVAAAYPTLGVDELPHEALRMIGEVLVARCREILPTLDPRHAAVLIRDRLLYDDPVSARPGTAPEGEIPVSALLPTSVWTGRLTKLVVELGVPARWDHTTQRLVATSTVALVGERIEWEDHLSSAERLTTTLRNSRSESSHG